MFKIAENDGDIMMLEELKATTIIAILNNNVIMFPHYRAIII